ncbi:MAG: FtsX-like permease family protein [Oscillospiraceae bacterium]|jgi:putative ABC transport system permease protein|nr:FtsX-like permease family protein [Oscillospiraceae bacterium]
MKLTAKLALSQLKANRRRTVLTLLGIVLSVSMITAVFGFVASARNAIFDTILKGGDYHVAYEGLTPEQADILAADTEFESSYTKEAYDGEHVALYCRLAQPSDDVWKQMADIAGKYNIGPFTSHTNTELLMLEGYAPDEYSMILFSIGTVLFLVIMFASIIVISNAFRVSAGERTKQFGILKSVGATSRQIRSSVVYEGLLLSVIGIPAGIAVGFLVEAAGCALAEYFFTALNAINNNGIHLKFTAPWWVIAIAATLAFVTIFLSAYLPARKASKIPAIEAIRGKGEIKLKAKKVLAAKLIRNLFGMEGELAAKSMKRSSRSYRATVVALASSVVLFLVGVSFGDSIMTSMDMLYPGIEATAIASVSSYRVVDTSTYDIEVSGKKQDIPPVPTSAEKAREATEKLAEYDKNADIRMIGMNSGEVMQTADRAILNSEGEQIDPWIQKEAPVKVTYILLDDVFYAKMCRQANAPLGSNLLVTQLMTRVDGKQTIISPFRENITEIDVISRDFDGNSVGSETIPIGGYVKALESELLWITGNSPAIYIITPDRGMNSLQWLVNIEDSAGFAKYAKDVLRDTVPLPATGNLSYSSDDIRASIAAQQGLVNLVMVMIYGFIAMLTLIGLTNVISTISTNIRFRRREFAMLVSMGMTARGIKRMINYESLLCGINSLLFGLIPGLLLSYFMYAQTTDLANYPYEFPFVPVIACALGVFTVTFITMRFSASRVRSENIIEAIGGNE